jgi:hypothetical protein
MDRNQAREKIAHEITEFLTVFLFVAPFLLSLEAYRIFLLHEPGKLFEYLAALANALVLSKIVLMGQLFGVGKRSEHQPLLISTVCKAAMFTLLYILFHVLERAVHGVVHGAPFLGALHGVIVRNGEVIASALAVFFAFIPFCALFEPRSGLARDPYAKFNPSSHSS